MTSVVRSLLHKPGKVRKVFFYWTKREANSAAFLDLMVDIHETDTQGLVEIRHFCTAAKLDLHEDNFGELLLLHAANAVFDEPSSEHLDIFLGYRTHHNQVGVGRPNWGAELRTVVRRAKLLVGKGSNNCGVFFCGPNSMANEIQHECLKISRQDGDTHVHFTKEIF